MTGKLAFSCAALALTVTSLSMKFQRVCMRVVLHLSMPTLSGSHIAAEYEQPSGQPIVIVNQPDVHELLSLMNTLADEHCCSSMDRHKPLRNSATVAVLDINKPWMREPSLHNVA
jgi:hypothetical protein